VKIPVISKENKSQFLAIRSCVAKFICIISYRNKDIQKKVKSYIPSSFVMGNLFIFSLPSIADSTVADLLKIGKQNFQKKLT